MMTKIVGAILVAGCSAAMGFSSVVSMDRRVSIIKSLVRCLESMRNDLDSQMPLEEILYKLQKEPVIGKMFESVKNDLSELGDKTFEHIWSKNVLSYLTESEKEEVEAVLTLGGTLGAYNKEIQLDGVDNCLKKLNGCLTEAESDRKSRGKVYGAMGILSGVAAVVVLI